MPYLTKRYVIETNVYRINKYLAGELERTSFLYYFCEYNAALRASHLAQEVACHWCPFYIHYGRCRDNATYRKAFEDLNDKALEKIRDMIEKALT